MGHTYISIVIKVVNWCIVPCSSNKTSFCNACAMRKSHDSPFQVLKQYTQPFQLVQTNIKGPSPMLTFDRFCCHISFVDMFTRYTWVYLIKTSSEVLQIFKIFKTMLNFNLVISLKFFKPTMAKSSLLLPLFWSFLVLKLDICTPTKWCGWEKK